MKLKLLILGLLATLFLLVMAAAVMAQEVVPAPYAGLKNPFPWGDAAAQAAGKGIYQKSCLGCHGVAGDNLPVANFADPGFPQELEAEPDYYFWILSEGAISKGMPPFKSSLSDEQRWQVLTYMSSLAKQAAPPPTPPASTEAGGSLTLAAPQQGQSGQAMTLTATLRDDDGLPIKGVPVQFFIQADFFAQGLMEIGDAVTDGNGNAVLEYTPRQAGNMEVTARYNFIEGSATVVLADSGATFYHPEAGLQMPAAGPQVFIGPPSSHELDTNGDAPTSALRLPGGIISWLLLFVGLVLFFWAAYFRVMFNVLRIQSAAATEDTGTRLIPLAGLVIVVVLGIMLALMLLTGPYSHFHLSP